VSVYDTVLPLSDASQPIAQPETLPLDALMRRMVDEGIKGLRVAFPAAITTVLADQTVNVQPLLKVRYIGQSPNDMPQIRHVPVIMPQGGDYRVSYPLAEGDTGLVLVADRSLDAWLSGTGQATDPQDTRSHHLADALFVPGLVPVALQTKDTGQDLVLGNGKMTLRLQKSGTLTVTNAANELMQVLHDASQALIDTLSAMQSAQVLTAFGPAPMLASSVAQFAQIQSQMTAILQRLDTFKGHS